MLSKFINVLLILILLAGISLLLYPSISDFVNKMHQTTAIAQYRDSIQEVDTEAIEQALKDAEEYNNRLYESADKDLFFEQNEPTYNSLLNLEGSGIMGYVEVPQINSVMPIYHGTSEGVLQIAIGHLEWTSLPIGGENTHTALSGHRGLPSAKLFTDLDLMKDGDIFSIHILNRTLYYQVDNISTVLPEESSSLIPTSGDDYCTLITCTPYGINSHRLLVRGFRIYPSISEIEVESDSNTANPVTVAAGSGTFIFIFIIGLAHFVGRIRRRKNNKIVKTEAE